MHAIMNTAITADAIGRLKASPPLLTGLSRKSPTVAPSGCDRMKAAQNRNTREMRRRFGSRLPIRVCNPIRCCKMFCSSFAVAISLANSDVRRSI